ncbi:hypothetical protein BSKO_14132 [Bryopsis sp. KO-2023]|nr:hypothetical protein BSKO_14132 [Bryopsis sp. KO-2023]
MEYADSPVQRGRLLRSLLDLVALKKDGLDEDLARHYFQQLIVAVDYCHRMKYDPYKADMFSCGVLLYKLLYGLAGWPVADGEREYELFREDSLELYNVNLRRLENRRIEMGSEKQVSQEVRDLLKGMLETNSEQRFRLGSPGPQRVPKESPEDLCRLERAFFVAPRYVALYYFPEPRVCHSGVDAAIPGIGFVGVFAAPEQALARGHPLPFP